MIPAVTIYLASNYFSPLLRSKSSNFSVLDGSLWGEANVNLSNEYLGSILIKAEM
jgi:hypothetical protein